MDIKLTDGSRIGYFEGGVIKDTYGNRIGYFDGDVFKDNYGSRLGFIEAKIFKDNSGSRLGFIEGNNIKDNYGKWIGFVDGNPSAIQVGAAGLILTRLLSSSNDPGPNGGGDDSSDSESPGFLAIALLLIGRFIRFLGRFFMNLSLAGKIGALLAFVLVIVSGIVGHSHNIIGEVIFPAILSIFIGGGLGTLARFIFLKLSYAGRLGAYIGMGALGLFLLIVEIIAKAHFYDILVIVLTGIIAGYLIGGLIGNLVGFIDERSERRGRACTDMAERVRKRRVQYPAAELRKPL